MEHWGVEPDIMTTAKALGGGFPISGITGRQELMDSVHASGVGHHLRRQPHRLRGRPGRVRHHRRAKTCWPGRRPSASGYAPASWNCRQRYPVIGDVRGLGAMVAMELVEDPETKKPAGAFAKTLRQKLFENGVVNIGAGTYHNVLRILVPLTIEDETLDRGLDILSDTMDEVSAARP